MAKTQRRATARARTPAVITALLVIVCIGLAARTALAGSAGQNAVRHSPPDAEQQGKTQASAGAGGPGAVSSSITSACSLAWSRVHSPSVGPSASVLVAVAAVAT